MDRLGPHIQPPDFAGRSDCTRIHSTQPSANTRHQSGFLQTGHGFNLVTRLKLINFDQDFLVLAFNLTDFDFDLARRVVRNCASVAAQVHVVFLAEIVLVEQSSAERRNADKKLAAIWSLKRFRCQ